ncbi:MAG: CoA transferase [Alphaproteobacteria bacterium]|nr:CoA transferase [Alphaproteobacteria bacterium]
MTNQPTGPLSGVRVIDITTIILGPYATQLLGDLGADIIKIEAPGAGDPIRHAGPKRNEGMGGIFLNVNRNKRSMVLDLKQDGAKEALRRLVPTADVFFHNMRPNAIERLGFNYPSVSELRPDIIYCGAYGYSEKGPYASKPAYDDLIQGASGLAVLGADVDGAPRYTPTILVDKLVGLVASQAILAALFHRSETGEGQEVEVPMFETMAAFMLAEHIYGRAFEPPIGGPGYARVTSPHRKPARAKDGYICILPYTEGQWMSFFEISDRQHLSEDSRFQDYASRNKNIDALYEMMGEAIAEKTIAEWADLCDKTHIPWAPVNTLDDLFDDEHLKAINFFRRVTHPSEGETVLPEPPVQFGATPASIHRNAPRYGEHGAEILEELGYTESKITALKESGALLVP